MPRHLLAIGITALLTSVGPQIHAHPSHRFQIGPVAGLTTVRHDAPAQSAIPLGATIDFIVVAEPLGADFDEDGVVGLGDFSLFARCFGGSNQLPATDCPLPETADLDADGDVDLADFAQFAQQFERTPLDGLAWSGATEVQRTPFQSVARRTFSTIGDHVVGASLSAPSAPLATFEFTANVIDVSPRDIEISPIIIAPTPADAHSDALSEFYGPSIAQIREVAPGSYVTSIERVIGLQVGVSPADFGPLIEWRVDGAPAMIGASAEISFNVIGPHTISASGRQFAAVETYAVTLLTDVDYHGAPPTGPLVFQAVTDPPGHEENITWIAGTLHGTATAPNPSGGSFIVSFENTFDPAGDADGIQQWYGVRADNARSGVLFFVEGDSPHAADTNLGTAASPWRTLNRAGNAARAGDTVIVRAGTYAEELRPANHGTPGNMIVFRAAPVDECRGDVSTAGMENKDGCNVRITGGVTLDRDYVRAEGFELTGNGIDACAVGVEVVNNYIHDITGSSEWGIHTCYDGNIGADRFTLIENNEITDITFKGIFAFGEGVVVRGNFVHDIRNDPSKVQGTNVLLEFNRLGHSWVGHSDGIEVYEADGLVIRNNHVYDTTQNIYLSAVDGPIRNVEIIGNVVWCDEYCAAGNNAPGVNCGPNTADITNVRVEGNTFSHVWMRFTDSFVQNPSNAISGLVIRANIFNRAPLYLELNRPLTSDSNLFFNPGLTIIESGTGLYNNLATYWEDYPTRDRSSRQEDPRFMNLLTWDLRLSPQSPAIDRAPVIQGLIVDSAGSPRPQGNGFDLGAYEFGLEYPHQ